MSKGIRGLLADDTTAQVSGEILFKPINNKEMELPKDREEGKAERSYLHISKLTAQESSQIQRLNSKKGRPVVQQPGDLPRPLFQLVQVIRPAAPVCCDENTSVEIHQGENGWIQDAVDL